MTAEPLVERVCDEFTPDKGGAHPWCAVCGWQVQYHEAAERQPGFAR